MANKVKFGEVGENQCAMHDSSRVAAIQSQRRQAFGNHGAVTREKSGGFLDAGRGSSFAYSKLQVVAPARGAEKGASQEGFPHAPSTTAEWLHGMGGSLCCLFFFSFLLSLVAFFSYSSVVLMYDVLFGDIHMYLTGLVLKLDRR